MDRGDGTEAAAAGRLDSLFAGLEGPRDGAFAGCFEAGREPLREPFRAGVFEAVLAGLAFKRMDLVLFDARLGAFFAALGLDLAFVAISAGTYKGYVS